MSIDVQVSGAGSITNGAITADPTVAAHCSLCAKAVDAAVSIGDGKHACPACLRDRLDALSVARFRLHGPEPRSIPWGKVTG